MQKKILFIFIFISIVFLTTCHSDKKTKTGKEPDRNPIVIDPGILDGIVDGSSTPPIEMAALVQEEGIPFSMKYLCPPNLIAQYKSDFKKTFGLGLLCLDLAYLNIYEKPTHMMGYISVIKHLSEDVHVAQFFDFPKLKRFAANKEKLDSLLYLSLHSFGKMDDYWREHDKSNLSTLFVSGVWLEGLYLTSQVVKQKRNKKIEERIAEQKTILKDLIIVLGHYKSNPTVAKLIAEFEKISKSFDGVEIIYHFGEPTKKTVNNRVVIEENTTSSVKMTKKQLNAIIKATEEVRNKWVGATQLVLPQPVYHP